MPSGIMRTHLSVAEGFGIGEELATTGNLDRRNSSGNCQIMQI